MMGREGYVSFRVNEKEERMIRQKMEVLGISNKSKFARKMVLDGYCIRLDIQNLQRLYVLLGKCSGNLNQYAKRANTMGEFYRNDMKELQTQFSELKQIAGEILDRLESLQ